MAERKARMLTASLRRSDELIARHRAIIRRVS
jgi:hypothetical protein